MFDDSERYERFKEEEFILRDQLAIDRTKLSADRTFLSYSRTALTMVIAGLTALHFIAGEGIVWSTLSWLSLFGGVVVFGYGLHSYQKMLRDIERGRERLKREKNALFTINFPPFRGFHFPAFMSEIFREDAERERTDERV